MNSAIEPADRGPSGDHGLVWCAACGYDLAGLPDGVRACPECGGDVSDRGRFCLRLLELGLTLLAWGIPLAAAMWGLKSLVRIFDAAVQQPDRPFWLFVAATLLVPTLGGALLARVVPGGAVFKSVALGSLVALAVVLTCTVGLIASGGYFTFWSKLGLYDRGWLVTTIAGTCGAGAMAVVLARVAHHTGMTRTSGALRALAWLGPLIAVGVLMCAALLQPVADSVREEARQAAEQANMQSIIQPGGAQVIRMPRVPWFWREGVPLVWAAWYAWSAAVAAVLLLCTVVVRVRVRELLAR